MLDEKKNLVWYALAATNFAGQWSGIGRFLRRKIRSGSRLNKGLLRSEIRSGSRLNKGLLRSEIRSGSRLNEGLLCSEIRYRWRLSGVVNFLVLVGIGGGLLFLGLPTAGAQPIVMRDLTVNWEGSVSRFDEHSVVLADGSRLGWDQILSATVQPGQQAEFDENLKRIGLPLFRLKERLRLKDWAGAGELAEPLYASLSSYSRLELEPISESQYWICVAAMQSRIAAGKRAQAVLPFLQAAWLHPKLNENGELDSIGTILSQQEIDQRLAKDLLPVWFDLEELHLGYKMLADAAADSSDPGIVVYLSSMAIALDDLEAARERLEKLDRNEDLWKRWRTVLSAQLDLAAGDHGAAIKSLSAAAESWTATDDTRALVWYFHSIAQWSQLQLSSAPIAAEKNSDQHVLKQNPSTRLQASKLMLELLKIPATDQDPELSAAALYQAAAIAQHNGWDAESEVLLKQLKLRFSETFFGRK